MPVTILFLGANGRNTTRLRLGAEVRDVRAALDKAGAGHMLRLEAELAVMPENLQELFQKHSAHVVHFSGHGSGTGMTQPALGPVQNDQSSRDLLPPEDHEAPDEEGSGGGLLLEDESGTAVAVKPEALTELIEIVQSESPLCCVVLNACFTASQAEAIAQHVDCVIGMKRSIDDRAAIAFAIAFYRALARGKSVRTAFKLGCNEIRLRRLPDKDVPALFHRPEVNPGQVFVPPQVLAARRRTLQAALSIFVLLGGIAAVFLLWPPAMAPKTASSGAMTRLLSPSELPAIAHESGSIVVAGPWLASATGGHTHRALCKALDEQPHEDGEGRVQCVDLPYVARDAQRDEELRRRAIDAGASLLVLVDWTWMAHIRPLGKLAGHEILDHGLPVVELSDAARPAQLGPILRSLAHVAEIAGDLRNLDPARLRCPAVDAGAARSITLLALLAEMFVPSCASSSVDVKTLLGACNGEPSDEADCKLAIFLYAYRFPAAPDVPGLIKTLNGDAAYRFLGAFTLRFGRTMCAQGKLTEARQAMSRLWESADPCVKLTASIVAACVLSEKKDAGPDEKADLRKVELYADDEHNECSAPMRGSVLGQRAWGRARGERWADAAADYRAAEQLDRKNAQVYRLNLIEVLLHQGQEQQAREVLRMLKDDQSLQDRQRIHAALLAWITGGRGRNAKGLDPEAQRLLTAYRSFPPGQRVFTDPSDPVLRSLACPGDAGRCVYDILADEKTLNDTSECILRQALGMAPCASQTRDPQ